MPTVVFLCVANAARSQMAEGLAQARAPKDWKVFSAGSNPASQVSRRATEVMREIGIDISQQKPKGMDEVPLGKADVIVTLCADEVCPVVPGNARKLHWPFPDPAAAAGSESEQRQAFRDVRDEIDRKLKDFWKAATARP
ncbi:MAG: arsenate reductase ArsC [Gemmatimonadetes bacterium]|nr:arsenate reductase ArsC [Gemmatimonadota bacterium]